MTDKPTLDTIVTTAEETFDLLTSLGDANALLNESEHTFQFDVDGGGSLFVDVRSGDASVHRGTADRDDAEVTRIAADAKTVHAILTGETAIVDEVWDSNARAQVYGMGMEDTGWLSRMLKRVRHERGLFIPRSGHTYGGHDP